jgi:uncharacterized NAD-dependent epimerase/dehydratase family protein
MIKLPEGNAVVYCQGAFGTPNGKTAHGLVRRTLRYRILSIIDASHAGEDAGRVLDGRPDGTPIFSSLKDAIAAAPIQAAPTHLVIGLAPDGGRLPADARQEILVAIKNGLNVDSGLHDFLSEDSELAAMAARHGVTLRDVRKPPHRKDLHFFSGKIEEVGSFTVALLGTDSAVGKRTTAWMLVDSLKEAGLTAELIGTGQTAWMQGARYSLILDSLVNDFVAGEIEHVVWSAWDDTHPDVIVIEGQGSLMNPAYPGGFEILAAGRPDAVVLQHAPGRKEYDGFPGYALHPLSQQIEALEVLSGKPVIAIAVNHEGLTPRETDDACVRIERETGLPTSAPLRNGVSALFQAVRESMTTHSRKAAGSAQWERPETRYPGDAPGAKGRKDPSSDTAHGG